MDEPLDLTPLEFVIVGRRSDLQQLGDQPTPVLDAAEALLAEVKRLREQLAEVRELATAIFEEGTSPLMLSVWGLSRGVLAAIGEPRHDVDTSPIGR
jgi:hypothetical protein